MEQSDILTRIQSKVDAWESTSIVDALTEAIPPSDLNALLLEVYRRIAVRTPPPELLQLYGANCYARSSDISALALARQEVALLELAEAKGIRPVVLSPAAPLGSCSAVAAVSQNKVLSALRGCELLADPTNLLALHICDRIRCREMSNDPQPVHLCATARVVRTQKFNRKDLVQHFSLYGMTSSGRDSGSYGFEKAALAAHIGFYRDFFRERLGAGITVVLRKCPGYKDPEGLMARLAEHVSEACPDVPLQAEEAMRDNAYYDGLQFTLLAQMGKEAVNIGDGGLVDWSRKLLSDRKERMLISAIGLDRLVVALAGG